MSAITSPKLYEEEITIRVVPYGNRWKAEATVHRPYKDWGGYDSVTSYAKTAVEATERVKDKLCKITAKEERKHTAYLERQAGIKETTFSCEKDCNPVVPRPRLFR
jgi:hypothetical protein